MKHLRKAKKIIACLLLLLFTESAILPTVSLALGSGPMQPEYSSFEPVNATDMVNLNTGDFTYNLPLAEVPGPEGGYPLNMFYHGGITKEQDASWVGLGWNLNMGAINRSVVGYPDDWKDIESGITMYKNGVNGSGGSVSINVNTVVYGNYGISVDYGTYKSTGIMFSGGYSVGVANVGASVGTHGAGVNAGVSGIGVGIGYYDGNTVGSLSLGSMGTGISFNKNFTNGSTNVSGTLLGIAVANISDVSDRNTASGGNHFAFTSQTNPVNLNLFFLGIDVRKYQFQTFFYKYDSEFLTGAAHLPTYKGYRPSYSSSSDIPNLQSLSYASDVYSNPDYKYAHDDFDLVPSNNFPAYDKYIFSGNGLYGSMSPISTEPRCLIGSGEARINPTDNSKIDENIYNFRADRNFANSDNINFVVDGGLSSYFNANPLLFSWDGTSDPITGVNMSPIGSTSELDVVNTGDPRYDPAHPEKLTFYNANNKRIGKETQVDYTYNSNGSIASYSITTKAGVKYNYGQPVYQNESYYLSRSASDPTNDFVIRKNAPYAYTWLLTSITGPDYVDRGYGGCDPSDWGYWVRFDYGKWADGFVWRSPNTGYITSNGRNSVEFGAKQIYYLDKISTRTHCALFVKSLRDDAQSQVLNESQSFSDRCVDRDLLKMIQKVMGKTSYCCNNDAMEYCHSQDPWFIASDDDCKTKLDYTFSVQSASSIRQLKLDKIIIVKNQGIVLNQTAGSSKTTNFNEEYTYKNYNTDDIYGVPQMCSNSQISCVPVVNYCYCSPEHQTPYTLCASPRIPSYKSELFENIIDEGDIGSTTFATSPILKEIHFDYDANYTLCPYTPNTPAGTPTYEGKLSLTGVRINGLNDHQIMPGYTFGYPALFSSKNPFYTASKADSWGFNSVSSSEYDNPDIVYSKPDADAWSMNDIGLPLGGHLKIQYESDDYTKEAAINSFAPIGFTAVPNGSGGYKIKFTNGGATTAMEGKTVKFNITKLDNFLLGGSVDVFGTGVYYSNGGGVFSPNTNFPNSCTAVLTNFNSTDQSFTIANSMTYAGASPINGSVGFTFNMSDNISGASFSGGLAFTDFIAQGGGIRVKQIDVCKSATEKYSTVYDYNDPTTGKTSGMTSFSPHKLADYIPYVFEMPSPGVLYEYVKVSSLGLNGASLGSTQYHFEQYKNCIDPTALEYEMPGLFSVHVNQMPNGSGWYANSNPSNPSHGSSVYFKGCTFENKLNKLGRPLEVSLFDASNHINNKTTYDYYDEDQFPQGIMNESYLSMRSTRWGSGYGQNVNYISTQRKNYPNALKRVTQTNSSGISSYTENTTYDFFSGEVTETQTKNSYGDIFRSRTVPAYTKYDGMNSMLFDPGNKNMLSQVAEQYSEKQSGSTWKTMGVGVTTWSNQWTDREFDNTMGLYHDVSSPGVWRKSADWVWKGNLNSDGSYQNFVDFMWSGLPGGGGWQRTNTFTKYDVFSHAIEGVGISGNYSSSKLSLDQTQVYASISNANYEEFAYCGFEDFVYSASTPQNFGGEIVHDPNMQIDDSPQDAHTGSFSMGVLNGSPVTIYKAKIGSSLPSGSASLSDGLALGKTYRASVWVHKNNIASAVLSYSISGGGATGSVNYMNVGTDGVSIKAGDWYLINLNIPILNSSTSGQTLSIGVSCTGGNANQFDDFRFQPIDAPMTSYVYDALGRVTHILGNNNFYMRYEYDDAGRLVNTYKETKAGEKKTSSTVYHYHGT
jgi:YD repeat-containing protein